MKQFAIIGISNFAKRMIEELSQTGAEILLLDKNKDLVQQYKDKVSVAYIADAINAEVINKLVPKTIDAAIIDLGDNLQVSILVTSYLSKMGIKEIIVKAETDEHGEILDIVGATNVIFPNREAAKKITPMLVSSQLFKYLPISEHLVIAEVKVPESLYNQTLIEADLRRNNNLNVIAIRKENEENYEFFTPDYKLQSDDVFLMAGKDEDVAAFAGTPLQSKKPQTIGNLLRRLLQR